MKKLSILLLTVFSLFVLSACGGGGGGDDGGYTVEDDFASFDFYGCEDVNPYDLNDPELNDLLDATSHASFQYCNGPSSATSYLDSYASTLIGNGFQFVDVEDAAVTHSYGKQDGSMVLMWLAMRDGYDVYMGWLVVDPSKM